MRLLTIALVGFVLIAADSGEMITRPGLFKQLTEPPCSYTVTEHRKALVRPDDRVIAWIRAVHNGGAIPLRHFLAVPRVINDTYGLFFYDADGDYVTAYKKDYGYEFHGWLRGVMVAKGPDGTLWSALSGRAIEGRRKGERLERIPSLVSEWGHWLMLHPESTAYNLFDGKKYPLGELPKTISAEAQKTMGKVDPRLAPAAPVLGVELGGKTNAFPVDSKVERAVWTAKVGGEDVAVLWYGPTRSAVAFRPAMEGRKLTFYADKISPETAPFKDKETGTRWTLAGRGVDGPLKGKELEWVPSVQCRWFSWAAEFPETAVHGR
jgi:hypothetical protein